MDVAATVNLKFPTRHSRGPQLTRTVSELIHTVHYKETTNTIIIPTYITTSNSLAAGRFPTHSRNNVIESHSLFLSHVQLSFRRDLALGKGTSSPWRSYKD